MCEQVKTYIDDKGKQWETIKETCPRCGGIGYHGEHGWQYYNNGACFQCEGKGYILTNKRILTDKEKEQRAKAKIRREQKAEELKLQQRNEKENKLNEFLLNNQKTYIVIDADSRNKKEELKANNYKWYMWNWAGFKAIAGIETIEVNTIDVINEYTIDLDEDAINKKVKEYRQQLKDIENAKLEYIGNIGDKIEIELTVENIISYDTQYGTMCINIYKDKQGNIYKWNSKNVLDFESKGQFKKVKATIKDHEEYNGQKQTVLTRCKIVEG